METAGSIKLSKQCSQLRENVRGGRMGECKMEGVLSLFTATCTEEDKETEKIKTNRPSPERYSAS